MLYDDVAYDMDYKVSNRDRRNFDEEVFVKTPSRRKNPRNGRKHRRDSWDAKHAKYDDWR